MQVIEFLNTMCITEINFVKTYAAAQAFYPMNIKMRRHHGLLLTVSGTETYHFKDTKIEAPPGSVLYIPKGENYEATLCGEESVVIVVDFEILGESLAPFLVQFSDQYSVKNCFEKIETEWKRKDADCLPTCKSLLYKIVGLTSRQLSLFLPSQKFSVISSAVNYLHENYMNADFQLKDLAKMSGVSYRYFETLFRQKFGVTPKEYLISMKIEKAKELLLSHEYLIRDIAIMLGYRDIYHFGKLFTAKTGYTPRDYRNNFH